MSFPNDRTYTFDANLQFSDNAAAYTASGYLQSGAADGVLDLGGNQGTSPAQQARIDAEAIFDITAIDIASGNETYQFDIMLSNDPAFAAANVVCAGGFQCGKGASLRGAVAQADSVIGRYEVGFCNQVAGTIYEYMKVYLTAGGTTPSISVFGFVAVLPEA